uniref:Elongation of very long chain fatty acids protein n=1 Tax=Globodera pallida TaxID=36090 RepID=A0A183C658_GLOPA
MPGFHCLCAGGVRHAVLMRNRPPFSLFIPLNAWNLFLTLFSIIGSVKLTPEFVSTLWNHGLQSSYCHVHEYTAGTSGFWISDHLTMIWKEIREQQSLIIDVLRKRPLLFLHWYHHIVTMLYAFYSYPIMPAFNRWGIYLNFITHSYMYSVRVD